MNFAKLIFLCQFSIFLFDKIEGVTNRFDIMDMMTNVEYTISDAMDDGGRIYIVS